MEWERQEPAERKEAFSFVHNDQFYVCHGTRGLGVLSGKTYAKDQLLPLQRFDFSSAQWSGVSPVCVDREPEERRYWREMNDHTGVCCAVLGNSAYTFGGFWEYGYAVHELNLETMVWRRLEPKNRENGPMHKCWAGMVACGCEVLCVFGGYGRDSSRHQPGATYHIDRASYRLHDGPKSWTNELHVFHIKKG